MMVAWAKMELLCPSEAKGLSSEGKFYSTAPNGSRANAQQG